MKCVFVIIFLIIAGCSQKPTTKSGFQLILGHTLDNSGGSFVNVIDPLKNTSTIFTLDANNSAIIEQGKYIIEAIVFGGPEFKTGTAKCGFAQAVSLNAAEASVVITLSSTECLNPRYNHFFLKLNSTTTSKWDLDQWDRSHWRP